jgi:hypothetical protein
MLHQIEQWIDQTNIKYQEQRVCCSQFFNEFEGFYPLGFLRQAYFVIVDTIPKPDFSELRQMGLGDFIDMDVQGITYKNTYFIKRGYEKNLALHFHELVHVQQWQQLGTHGFISRYIREINLHGYNNAPLEKMAYLLQSDFECKKQAFDIVKYVQKNI